MVSVARKFAKLRLRAWHPGVEGDSLLFSRHWFATSDIFQDISRICRKETKSLCGGMFELRFEEHWQRQLKDWEVWV